ncbi:hypothetical protein CAPTEDRAFT_128904, partial [Capitella teleta]
VAVKSLRPRAMSTDTFLEEAQVMTSLAHKNIVQLLAVCTQEEPILIVTEYFEYGNLLSYMRSPSGVQLEVKTLLKIAENVAEGMAFIEKKKCIHRKLSAKSIFLTTELAAKVGDFDFAKNSTEFKATEVDVQQWYIFRWMALESILYGVFTIKSDVWSYGIVLIEIISRGASPYSGMTPPAIMMMIEEDGRCPQPDTCPDSLYEIMLQCWAKNPADRPTFEFLADYMRDLSL